MSLPLREVIYIAVKPIFKIYLILGVGIILARKNILTVETSRNISSIAINVLIPCLAFQKIVSNISNDDIHQIATIVIISFFSMGLGTILCFSFGLAAGCPKTWWGGLLCCGLLPNISDLPIAYLQTMESSTIFNDIDKGVSYVIIYLTLQMLVQFNFGAFKLIELDFHTEAKLQQQDQEEKDNVVNESLPPAPSVIVLSSTSSSRSLPSLSSSSSSSSSSNSALSVSSLASPQTPARSLVPVSSSSPGRDRLHILKSRSGDQESLSSSVSSQYTDPTLQPVVLTASARGRSEPLSRTLSVPRILLARDIDDPTPEGINDIIRVYSKYNLLEPITVDMQNSTEEAKSLFRKSWNFIIGVDYRKLFKSVINLWIASMTKVISITLVLSITICMIPWVQALFINTHQAHLHPAPDGEPALSFILDFAGYIGAAEVPFGLLLLGGTIGRLNFLKIPLRVWKVPIAVTFARLFIMPIIGCAFNSKIHKDGLFYNEEIMYFIANINFCLPPATTLLYITAFYTPVDNESHIQMDYLALIYIFHYVFLVVCMPFTTTYTMKIPLHL